MLTLTMSFRYTSKKYERDLCEEHIVRVDHGGSCNRKVIVACTVIIGFILYWLSLISEDGSLPIAIAAILVLLCCIYLHFIQVYQESLLVVASTGVQFTTTYQTGRKKHLFIPISSIHDIVISEAVTMHRIIYYLVVLIKCADNPTQPQSLIPLFMKTYPRIGVLKEMYRGIQHVLWKTNSMCHKKS